MFKSATFLLLFVLTFLRAERVDYDSCYLFAENPDGPRSVEVEKTDQGWSAKINFIAKRVGASSPLKIKHTRSNITYSTALIEVSYPITNYTISNTYEDYTIIVPIPEVKYQDDDTFQISLHRIEDDDVKESAVWCFKAYISELHGIKHVVRQPSFPVVLNSAAGHGSAAARGSAAA